MSFTFTTLRETVQDYTQNDETSFIANMGMFVELAEERVPFFPPLIAEVAFADVFVITDDVGLA